MNSPSDVLLLSLGLDLQLWVCGHGDGRLLVGLASVEPPAAGDAQQAADDGRGCGDGGCRFGAEIQLGEGKAAPRRDSESDLFCKAHNF